MRGWHFSPSKPRFPAIQHVSSIPHSAPGLPRAHRAVRSSPRHALQHRAATAPNSSHTAPLVAPPPLPYAGRRLAHLAGRRRLLTPVGSEGSGAMRSSHAGTSSSIWVAQACSLRQVAPTQRYPGPYCQHQQPHIALTSPHRWYLALPAPRVVWCWQGTGVLLGFPTQWGCWPPGDTTHRGVSPRYEGRQKRRMDKKRQFEQAKMNGCGAC